MWSSDNEANDIQLHSKWTMIYLEERVLHPRRDSLFCPISETEIVIIGGIGDCDNYCDTYIFNAIDERVKPVPNWVHEQTWQHKDK